MLRIASFGFSLLSIFLALTPHAAAEYYPGDFEEVPIERLLENLTRNLEKNPEDSRAHYLFARVHTMAFASDRTRFRMKPGTGLPALDDGASGVFIPPNAPALASGSKKEEARRKHLEAAIRHYRRALELNPDHLASQVGLGWSLLKAGEREESLEVLRPAFERAWEKENDSVGMEIGRSLTLELGRYLLELIDPNADTREFHRIRRRMKAIDARPKWVTPILIPLVDGAGLASLTTAAPEVVFDLDGSGAPRRWQWITPRAGWLVHDPFGRGEITSGRQLLGAVTFWVFWSDGYEALASLDDNADGVLRGEELRGLAIWRDANTNGVSEPGEVRPLADWGVTALACEGRRVSDTVLMNERGARFEDGRTRPTYDWRPKGVPLETSR